MSKLLLTGQHRFALQLCVAGAAAALMGGCSSDATRLGDPFSNPFSTASNEAPQSRRHVASNDVIPAGRTPPVTSQALAARPVGVASLSPSRPAVASRQPVSSETTGSIERTPMRTASGASFGGWSSAGGTQIQVADGDTADILSKRYGVPANTLLQVNGLSSAAQVQPGSRLIIPIYSASTQQAAPARLAEEAPRRDVARPAPVVAATKPAKAVAQAPVAKPIKNAKLAHETGKPAAGKAPVTTAALAPKPLGKLPVVTKGVATVAKADPVAAPQPVAAKAVKTAAAMPVPAKPVKAAALAAPVATTVVTQTVSAAPASAAPAAPAAAVADNSPEFRWPARGRIIQGFKSGSGGNDGINIAVPEGTTVKAAEGGVVAYAGSELKGYGNLVLIRHPNGFVSAYANNGELDVKRGETVKRGQAIAKSGQSGNVSSPQLHFELRKGSTPVDPTQYLAGL